MPKMSLKGKLGRVAAATAILGLGATTFITQAPLSGADPQQSNALVAVGSDTIQPILNALGGYENGINYFPIQSDLDNGARTQIANWDATNPDPLGDACITPKVKAATIYRSNGSSEGRRALSRGIQGAQYGGNVVVGSSNKTVSTSGTGAECASPGRSTSGIVDLARSSSGPSGTTGALTYIPFGKDAVTFAYYKPSGSAVTALNSSQLQTLFQTGPTTIGTTRYVPIGIQSGSGTWSFWRDKVSNGNTATEQTATAYSQLAQFSGGPNSVTARVQEHDGNDFKNKADRIISQTSAAAACTTPGVNTGTTVCNEANTEFVIGFSAAQFIAQKNGVAKNRLPASGVDLGAVDALGVPYSVGAGGKLSPSSGFYASTTYGRRVYVVADTNRIQDEFGDFGMKGLLVSTDSGKPAVPGVSAGHVAAICSTTAQTLVDNFGFLSEPSVCGTTNIKGDLVIDSANPLNP